MDDFWTVDLGSNIITNCQAALVVEDVEVFRLKDRSGDGQLVADFDLYDVSGERLAKIAKNNVVYARDGLVVRHGVSFSEVVDSRTGQMLARAEEVRNRVIKISGDFYIHGFHVLIDQEEVIFYHDDGSVMLSMAGNRIIGGRRALSLKRGSFGIGG